MGAVTEFCRCSACNKSSIKVELLIMLNREKHTYICNECIDDCNQIIADKRKECQNDH